MNSRAENVFLDAIELDGAARLAFLESACGVDSELRDEVETLLIGRERAASWLRDSVSAIAREWSAFTDDPQE